MSSEPVTVWVSTDDNGRSLLRLSEPENVGGVWYCGDMALVLHNSPVPPGECREYVLIPADQYRSQQPTAELSPVAKLIAELSVSAAIEYAKAGNAMTVERTVDLAAAHVEKAIAAARKIEGKADV